MEGLVSANALICESVENKEGKISTHNMFNVINLNEYDGKGFCVVVFASIVDKVNCDLHIYLENHTNEEKVRFKKLKVNSINNDDQEIESLVQIFRFESKKMISDPGYYYISVYKTEQNKEKDNKEDNKIMQRTNLVSYTPLEVK